MRKRERNTSVLRRRVLILCLSLALVLGSALTIIAVTLSGDISGDEKITAFDGQMLAENQAGNRELNEQQQAQAEGWTVQNIINTVLGKPLEEPEQPTEPTDPSEPTEPAEPTEPVLPEGPVIVIGNVTGAVGQQVEVTFDLQNSPALYAMSLKIGFDDTALTLVSAESGEAMGSFTYMAPSRLKNGSNFMWYANDPAAADGTVLTLVFAINTGAAGTYPITMTCDPGNTYDADDNDVNIDFVQGSIAVTP